MEANAASGREDLVTPAALADAFLAKRKSMYAIARAVVGYDAASDVIQDVLLRIWRSPTNVDLNRGSLEQYLIVLTRGIAIDHLRSTNRRSARESLVHRQMNPVGSHGDIAVGLVDQFTVTRLSEALQQLPPDDRTLIVTAFYGQISYRRIAELTGTPEGTVKSRVRRVLQQLRRELRDLQIEGPSATLRAAAESLTD